MLDAMSPVTKKLREAESAIKSFSLEVRFLFIYTFKGGYIYANRFNLNFYFIFV